VVAVFLAAAWEASRNSSFRFGWCIEDLNIRNAVDGLFQFRAQLARTQIDAQRALL